MNFSVCQNVLRLLSKAVDKNESVKKYPNLFSSRTSNNSRLAPLCLPASPFPIIAIENFYYLPSLRLEPEITRTQGKEKPSQHTHAISFSDELKKSSWVIIKHFFSPPFAIFPAYWNERLRVIGKKNNNKCNRKIKKKIEKARIEVLLVPSPRQGVRIAAAFANGQYLSSRDCQYRHLIRRRFIMRRCRHRSRSQGCDGEGGGVQVRLWWQILLCERSLMRCGFIVNLLPLVVKVARHFGKIRMVFTVKGSR